MIDKDPEVEVFTVKSTNILKVGYKEKTQAMYVAFGNGSEYEYTKVTREELEVFLRAHSLGTYFFKNFKNNPKYNYKRVS